MIQCGHPYCLRNLIHLDNGSPWEAPVEAATQGTPNREAVRALLLDSLVNVGSPGDGTVIEDEPTHVAWKRLLELCPCLYTQVPRNSPAQAVVHLAEVSTPERRVTAQNIERLFAIQHPDNPQFRVAPLSRSNEPTSVGRISEEIVARALESGGIPKLKLGNDGWPAWHTSGFIDLNGSAKLKTFKNYGDLLLLAAPSNLLISVKSETARERLLASGTRDVVGVGFFKDPAEFWSVDRATNYRDRGFLAIYMPSNTREQVENQIGELRNVNSIGSALYRDLASLVPDLKRVAGKSIREL